MKRWRREVGQQDRELTFSERLVAGQVIKRPNLQNGNEITGVTPERELGIGGATQGPGDYWDGNSVHDICAGGAEISWTS